MTAPMMNRPMTYRPTAYQQGWVEYRGRRFQVDERVFITDPETGYMLDVVIAHLQAIDRTQPLLIAELGTGCGAIGISLLKEAPKVRLVGLEIDPRSIDVARSNIAAHGVDFEVLQSDFFSAWNDRPEPAIIFGDLPWGDESSVYDSDRPIEHYFAMPKHSAFPIGGPLGMHRTALESVKRLGWRSDMFLNCGMLPLESLVELTASVGAAYAKVIRAAENVSVLHCRMT